jgi:hypothetical protein
MCNTEIVLSVYQSPPEYQILQMMVLQSSAEEEDDTEHLRLKSLLLPTYLTDLLTN